jgi:Tfp pilus assembly protein PilF
MQCYQDASEYDPCDARAWIGRAQIHWKRRQYSALEDVYRDALYYNPNHPSILQTYAEFQWKMGQFSSAEKLLTKAIYHHPQHTATWLSLAKIHFHRGEEMEGKSCLDRAYAIEPENYVVLQSLGCYHLRCHQLTEARNYLTTAHQLHPTSVHTISALIAVEEEAGNVYQALALCDLPAAKSSRAYELSLETDVPRDDGLESTFDVHESLSLNSIDGEEEDNESKVEVKGSRMEEEELQQQEQLLSEDTIFKYSYIIVQRARLLEKLQRHDEARQEYSNGVLAAKAFGDAGVFQVS